MINQQLLTYIQNQQEAGTDDAKIKANLKSAGWREEDINEGFQAVKNNANGGNSTEAHQQMRAEAAKERGSQTASGDDADTGDSNQPTDSSSESDTYREPVTEADKEGPAGGTDPSDLSPIDEETSGGSTEQEQQAKDDGSGKASPDNQALSEESQSQPGPDEISDSNTAGNPLESDESIHQMKGKSDEDHDDVGPVAVRTFSSDRQRAGMSGSSGSSGIDIQKNQPDTKKPATAGSGVNLPDNEPNVRKRKSDTDQPESNQSQPEKSQPSKQSTQPKKPDTMLDVDKQSARQPEKSHQPDSPMQQQVSKEAAKIGGQKQTSDRPTGMESSADRGQRFSASGDVEEAKKRAAARRKQQQSQASSGSGSNLTSILIFIVALALVGGGAYYAYMTFFQTSSSDTTASAVMQSLAEAGSFNFRTAIESAGSDGVQNQIIIEGAVDLNQDTPTQSYYTITETSEGAPIQTVMAETENIATVPAAQKETIRDLLLSPEFFSVGEFQTQENLADFTTNRFSASADPSQLVSDYATFHQAFFDTPLSQTVLSKLQKYVSGFEPTQGQAWIDPETGVPYQITFIGTGSEGEDMQVNLQFKNHGSDLAANPSYAPRSIEQSLKAYFSDTTSSDDTDSAPPTDEGDDSEDTSESSTEDQQPATSSQTDDDTSSEESDDDPATTTDSDESAQESQANRDTARRQDQLRINDLHQITIALRLHARDTGSFPTSLQSLVSGGTQVLSSVPTDPVSGQPYLYSASGDGARYHVGAVLRELSRIDVISNDANFNSRGQGFPNGFNGATVDCGRSQVSDAITCYDLTGSAE